MYECMNVCLHVCMHVCMYACMHVCMYACACVYVHTDAAQMRRCRGAGTGMLASKAGQKLSSHKDVTRDVTRAVTRHVQHGRAHASSACRRPRAQKKKFKSAKKKKRQHGKPAGMIRAPLPQFFSFFPFFLNPFWARLCFLCPSPARTRRLTQGSISPGACIGFRAQGLGLGFRV